MVPDGSQPQRDCERLIVVAPGFEEIVRLAYRLSELGAEPFRAANDLVEQTRCMLQRSANETKTKSPNERPWSPGEDQGC